MGINLRKVPMDNKLQRMVTIPQYVSSPASYQPNKTVIDNGRNMMLPLITQAAYEKGNVGLYIDPNSFVHPFNMPEEEDRDKYDIEKNKNNIIDFSDCNNYHDIISKQKAIKEVRSELMTNADHVSYYPIGDNDTRLMAGLKEAINSKECDINCYEPNFDGNFLNDIRILNGESITDKKTIKFGNAMDIKVTVRFEDKSPDVPNPMGKVVEVELTGGDEKNG